MRPPKAAGAWRVEAAPEGVAEAEAPAALLEADEAFERTLLRALLAPALAEEADALPAAEEMVVGMEAEAGAEAGAEAPPATAEAEPVAARPPPVPVKTGAV